MLSGGYFFILQSLITSKMIKFRTIKLSQLHKEKTCWTENCLVGLWATFEGSFYVLFWPTVVTKKRALVWFLSLIFNPMRFCFWLYCNHHITLSWFRPVCQLLMENFGADRVWSRDNSAHQIRFRIKWPASSPDLRLVSFTIQDKNYSILRSGILYIVCY